MTTKVPGCWSVSLARWVRRRNDPSVTGAASAGTPTSSSSSSSSSTDVTSNGTPRRLCGRSRRTARLLEEAAPCHRHLLPNDNNDDHAIVDVHARRRPCHRRRRAAHCRRCRRTASRSTSATRREAALARLLQDTARGTTAGAGAEVGAGRAREWRSRWRRFGASRSALSRSATTGDRDLRDDPPALPPPPPSPPPPPPPPQRTAVDDDRSRPLQGPSASWAW